MDSKRTRAKENELVYLSQAEIAECLNMIDYECFTHGGNSFTYNYSRNVVDKYENHGIFGKRWVFSPIHVETTRKYENNIDKTLPLGITASTYYDANQDEQKSEYNLTIYKRQITLFSVSKEYSQTRYEQIIAFKNMIESKHQDIIKQIIDKIYNKHFELNQRKCTIRVEYSGFVASSPHAHLQVQYKELGMASIDNINQLIGLAIVISEKIKQKYEAVGIRCTKSMQREDVNVYYTDSECSKKHPSIKIELQLSTISDTKPLTQW